MSTSDLGEVVSAWKHVLASPQPWNQCICASTTSSYYRTYSCYCDFDCCDYYDCCDHYGHYYGDY